MPMTLTAPRIESPTTEAKRHLTTDQVSSLKKSFAENGNVVLQNVVATEGLIRPAAAMQLEFEN
jgi:hypothetical protein